MRRGIVAGVASALILAIAPGVTEPEVAQAAPSVSENYTWDNVEIAGGGFVPGIVFNQSEEDLIYARTDIGGAYRWNPDTERWIPLTDHIGWDDWNLTGVASLATDPVDTDRVYLAAGTYTNDWTSDNGAILRSSDRGETWERTDLPFKVGGNMPGRGMGERLAIDPNDNSVLYFGAPSGNGLWKSTDYGQTWSEVTNFPNPGNYVHTPDDPYLGDNQGVVWVTFDPRTGSSGSPTQTLYVGVADKENSVYRTTDGGATWERVEGQPTGFLPHKGVLDDENGYLYIATSDTGGPYDGGSGDVWRYNTADGTWTQISPIPSSSEDNYFGYSGLTIDRQNPSTIMVATQISWWPDVIFFRSTDSGETWTRVWNFTSYPNRNNRYEMDISSVPWLDFGQNPSPPEQTPKLGWMTESLEIDPFNSDRMMYGTGATIYGTNELTNWDQDETFTIEPMVHGLEETSVKDLISPPSGAPLISGLLDVGGFRHEDLNTVPDAMFTAPSFDGTTSLDYAENNPNVVVRVGNFDREERPNDSSIAFSTDNGANWFQASEPSGVTGSGTVAAAADGSSFVWSPEGPGVHYSEGFGNSWTAATGIPDGARVESDRVNADTFYGYSAGTFYVSTDGGATFSATAATGLPSESVRFKAVPGMEGEIWLAGGTTDGEYGLWHSSDGGESFTKLSNVEEADTIGFGKAAPGQDYMALYTSAKIDGVRGIYRSDDAGQSWVRINDDQNQWGWTGETITGDPNVYGRVYVSTNGRGIIYGETSATGGDDTTAPSVPGDPSASNVTATGATLSWDASTDTGGSGLAGYEVYHETSSGDELVASPSTTSTNLSGLAPETEYTYHVVAVDGAGNTSEASATVTFTTGADTGGDDTTAPSVPGDPSASNVTATGATLSWDASTDTGGSGLAGYEVYRETSSGDELVASPSTTSTNLSGLAPETEYTYHVVAVDGAGNTSEASATVTFTTEAQSGEGAVCAVDYSVANEWNSGFTGSVTVTNTGDTAIQDWELAFDFTAGQQLTNGWSAQWSQSGTTVTATAPSWASGDLAPGASVTAGFNASHSGNNPVPEEFTVNGTTCD
ncbi:cellulose binding domain-containing protein [Salinactinospora qingdaonensis]|uniref:Cellulose binding domain-containing protein n=1 Tax=Salinactinospora qingdaonensis TaxID=702744 RepID=A0ABP7F1C2_9ACTN